ncbi:MAG: CDP-diacylglycerol--glycerol-3-phosphate 3-phosphatidyltransferase [Bdellovibrio sp. CG10_big_fil_rev_8_21_14_0_10_47_8]|nr:MAG: CDP-diacylglycerol--glycerol-3-phosphate 3-phosphatidyltransferase [Bdellovibrio sp. CG10_big_fil_rev_8_21_14_0_10_47_8]
MPEWKKKLPMWITMSRIFTVPVIVALLYPNQLWTNIASALLFILSSITDYYDGYFARKFNATSTMGKFMDPIADKILVTSTLVMLIPSERIDPLMVIIILSRDIFIGGIRSIAAADQIIIDAKPVGKWKTALQMVAIPAVMIDQRAFQIPFEHIGYWVLWISTILSVTSGAQYYFGYLKAKKALKP